MFVGICVFGSFLCILLCLLLILFSLFVINFAYSLLCSISPCFICAIIFTTLLFFFFCFSCQLDTPIKTCSLSHWLQLRPISTLAPVFLVALFTPQWSIICILAPHPVSHCAFLSLLVLSCVWSLVLVVSLAAKSAFCFAFFQECMRNVL